MGSIPPPCDPPGTTRRVTAGSGDRQHTFRDSNHLTSSCPPLPPPLLTQHKKQTSPASHGGAGDIPEPPG